MYIQKTKGGLRKSWLTKLYHVKIAAQNLFSPLVNRNSTRKKGLKTNHRDAQLAEKQENSAGIISEGRIIN